MLKPGYTVAVRLLSECFMCQNGAELWMHISSVTPPTTL